MTYIVSSAALNSTHSLTPTTKQHAVVSTQLNIVTCATYPEKFIRDGVVAPFLLLSVVIVTLQSKPI